MIDAHELGQEVGPDVYSYPLDDMDKQFLGAQLETNRLLKRLVDYGDRAREKEAPDTVDLSPASGSPIARTYTTKTGLRVIAIVISGMTGDQFRLTVGLRPYNFWNASGSLYLPFPIEIAQGIDLTAADITNTVATAWSFYVLGYPF